jgi:hypothetical protein
VTPDAGEEHELSLYEDWELQKMRIGLALGRPMIPDDSQPAEDGVISVKSSDGSPPDPTFDRVMDHPVGAKPEIHRVRVHSEDTPESIRAQIPDRHPDVRLTEMLIGGAIVDDNWQMGAWLTRTGESHIEVNWDAGDLPRRFYLWTEDGERELNEEDTKRFAAE